MRLKKGDVVCYESKVILTQQQVANLKAELKKQFPLNEVVVTFGEWGQMKIFRQEKIK
jgi:hypothetical protein